MFSNNGVYGNPTNGDFAWVSLENAPEQLLGGQHRQRRKVAHPRFGGASAPEPDVLRTPVPAGTSTRRS